MKQAGFSMVFTQRGFSYDQIRSNDYRIGLLDITYALQMVDKVSGSYLSHIDPRIIYRSECRFDKIWDRVIIKANHRNIFRDANPMFF